MTIGETIQRFRTERGLSESELATRVGMRAARLQEIEAGTRQPLVPTLHQLAAALAVPVTDFLPVPHTLGERVTWWRTVRGISRLEFSKLVGMNESAIIKVEKDRTQPYNRTLQRLAAALDVAVADLVPAADAALLQRVLDGQRPRTRDDLHTLARSVGRPLKALFAMSDDSDPFAIGTPTQWRDARWFHALWERFQFPQGVHLRRIHYRLLSYPLELPTGTPYTNTWDCYVFLNDAGRYARILGLVAPDAFDDRRNPPPHLHNLARAVPEPSFATDWWPDWDFPSIDNQLAANVELRLPAWVVYGYDYHPADQPYLLEVWIEKSTMDDVLLPLCQQVGANLVTSVGMQSITNVVKLLQRVAAAGKPARIFYISDFDPAGQVMPAAVSRQVEYWLARYAPDADIKLMPLALTYEQVDTYDLPRTPLKAGDTRREHFEDLFGEGAVELDALEALHPGVLAQMVRAALDPYLDHSLPARLARTQAAAHKAVSDAWNPTADEHAAAVQALTAEARTILRRYDVRLKELDDDLQADLAPLAERLAELREAVDEATVELEVALPPRPEPNAAPQDESEWLFAAHRDYLEQLAVYQARKHGGDVATDDVA